MLGAREASPTALLAGRAGSGMLRSLFFLS